MLRPLERARKTKDPCPGCGLHRQRCLCALIPHLELRTRVTLVVHAKELKRTTNTGTLALKALSNSSLRVRGEGRDALDLSPLLGDDYQPILLYPSADALILNAEFMARQKKPLHLIVPDGNWRQASKVNTRHPELAGIPRVMVHPAEGGRDRHLRRESTPHGMSTLEAIAQALLVIEGPLVGEALLRLYHEKLERTLAGRGF